jgi:Uma2 family endonuclease
MAMPTQQTRWTAEMVQDLPDDDKRYEVIDGELFVTPAPSHSHQRASAQPFKVLEQFGVSIGLEVLYAPGAITFSSLREVQPDLYAFRRRPGKAPERYIEMGQLFLAVEILSPSTARVDRYRKRALYQSERVRECWVVDVDALSASSRK